MAQRRRRKTKGQSARDTPAGGSVRRQLIASLESLEVTRGNDGLLRGKPEAALLLAAYRVSSAALSLVGRLVTRVPVAGAPPCVIRVHDAELRYATRVRATERFVLLALALEEDSGEGVGALYGALESPVSLELWSLTEAVPSPRALSDWAGSVQLPPEAVPVEMMLSTQHARELSGGDELIATCALCIHAGARHDEVWRLPFADDDGKNQWTATLRVRVV